MGAEKPKKRRDRKQRRANDSAWPLAHQAYQRLKHGQSTLTSLPADEREQLIGLWKDLITGVTLIHPAQAQATVREKISALPTHIINEIEAALGFDIL